MKRNDIFTFTTPNGVEGTAVVINELSYRVMAREATTTWICYAQNRLFTYKMIQDIWNKNKPIEYHYGEVLVDYAILPDYDAMLENYLHQQDMANDHSDKTL